MTALYLGDCVISPNKVILYAKTEVPDKTILRITINRAKNPAFVGLTEEDAFKMTVYYPGLTPYRINYGTFGKIRFFQQKNVNRLYLKIISSNLYKNVSANYRFSLQNTRTLPSKGKVTLNLPPEWGKIIPANYELSKVYGSFSNQKLIYSV